MTLTDILLIAATLVFVLAWWIRKTPARRFVLIVAAAAMLTIGIAGYMNFRWQNAAGSLMALIYFAGLGVTVLKNHLTRTDITGGVPFVSGLLVALGAVAVIAMIVTFPVWPLPKPSGQHPVGVRTFEITDASRTGVFMTGPTEPRRLLVRVWYPAQSVSGDPAPYFSDAEANSTATSMGSLVGFPPFFTYTRHVKTNSWIDAPLLEGAANLPTVFYSHGYTSFLNQNTSLMEELASHGYVVFSVQHTYDSADTAFPNGDVAPIDPKLFEVMGNEADRPSQADALAGGTLDNRLAATLAFQEFAVKNGDRIAIQSTQTWVADRLFLHDALETSPPASIAEIARASNLAKVGELGMSFGGAIAGEICMIDGRCAAGVNMDGGNFPFSAFNANVPAPFLMFHSDLSGFYKQFERPLPADGQPRSFNEFSYERIADAGKRPDVYRVYLKGSQHLGLSDFAWFVGQPVRGVLFGDAPADLILAAQNDVIRGFLDKHLRGLDNGFPQTQLADYKDWVFPAPNSDIPAWWNAKPEAERAALEARIKAAKPVYVLPDITFVLPPTPEQAANAPH